jgi:uncharacterized protein YjiS (DUF1127 family)
MLQCNNFCCIARYQVYIPPSDDAGGWIVHRNIAGAETIAGLVASRVRCAMGTTFQTAASGRTDQRRAQAAANYLIGALHRMAAEARDALLRAKRRRATIEALRRLDDRALNDIGLTRDRIGAAVGQIYGRRPTANENEPPMAA